jgi:tetratricopeptide (TPR) repeat protein
MRKATCSICGSEQPSGEMFSWENRALCAACSAKRAGDAAASGEAGVPARMIDPTICSFCNSDHDDRELPLVGDRPACGECTVRLHARPFPLWVKASLALLLVLLGVALWHGRRPFSAGRHMMRGERAMAHQDYKAAGDEFAQVLNVFPDMQKAILLGAKAHFMDGDPDGAMKFLNGRASYDHDALYLEVNGLFKRSVSAVRKARRAVQLDAAGQSEEAARLMNEAATEYSQAQNLGIMAQVYSARAAFYRKDYDASLKFSQAAWDKNPADPNLTASLAAALACKYAVTGDPQFQTQAEQMLAKARELSDNTPANHAAYLEYSPRILYRLKSREIIDNAEYQRRFGAKP